MTKYDPPPQIVSIQQFRQLDKVPIDYKTKFSNGIPIPGACPDCKSTDTQMTKYNSKYDWSIECLGCNQVIERVIEDGTVNPKYRKWVKI